MQSTITRSSFAPFAGARRFVLPGLLAFSTMAAVLSAQQATVTYELSDVWLQPTTSTASAQQMTGAFVWTYTPGDFENGSGEFTSLNVPFGGSGIGRLDSTIEDSSLEVTLDGNYHDRGVDVSLKYLTPISEFLPAPIDTVLSKWQVEIGTITAGDVISGEIIPTCWSPFNYGSGSPGSAGFVPTIASSGGEPRIGNTALQVDCTQVLGGATGVLMLGFGQVQIPVIGVEILVSPTGWILTSQVASGTPGSAGIGTLQFATPVPGDLSLVGIEVDFQLLALDPGAPQGPASTSAGLSMTLCAELL